MATTFGPAGADQAAGGAAGADAGRVASRAGAIDAYAQAASGRAHGPYGLGRLFDLDQELTLPAFFSTLQSPPPRSTPC